VYGKFLELVRPEYHTRPDRCWITRRQWQDQYRLAQQGVDQRADGRNEEREGDLLLTALSGTFTGESFTITTELGYSLAKQTRSDPLLQNMR
jgi:hypothetical protein